MLGSDILPKARAHVGERYVLGAHAPLDNSEWTGPWDCAEYTSWLAYQTYGIVYGCGTTDLDRADPYSGFWADDARNRGVLVPVEQAAVTPGAFLVRIPVGGAHPMIGHVAIAIGDGKVYEAAGAQLGVRVGPIEGRRWDLGVLLPGVDYATSGQSHLGGTASPLVLRRQASPRFDERVVDLQVALKEHGVDPGRADGLFGRATEAAVHAFQLSTGLIPDGEVGPTTGRALGLPFWGATPTPGTPTPLPGPTPNVQTDAFGAIVSTSTSYSSLEGEYAQLFATCVVQDRNGEIANLASRIAGARDVYADLVAGYNNHPARNMPWYFVALIHSMEAAGDVGRFRTHLHNGDPLTRPTVHVPAGRPNPTGTNFSWSESAYDALQLAGYDTETDWSLPRMLFHLEKYNGFGPRRKGHATAYLWSYSNHYIKGKYVADGVWSDTAVSRQPGAAAILKQLVDDGVVTI